MVKFLSVFFILITGSVFALEESDRQEIENVISAYTVAWNQNNCIGFADGFTEDADFVNIFGMYFSGREEIEKRHQDILKNFLKGSTFEVTGIQLREAQPGLVIAIVLWNVKGFGNAETVKKGIFTQVFIKTNNGWAITASQNTLSN